MDDNNKAIEPLQHASVIAELDELDSLILLMLTSDMSTIAPESRKHLLALAYRVTSAALDKAHGRITD